MNVIVRNVVVGRVGVCMLCTYVSEEWGNIAYLVVYYETINRELNKRLIYECRCDERLKTKVERSTCLTYTVCRGGLEHLKINVK